MRKTIIIYGSLLMMITLLGSLVLITVPCYARYDTAVAWNMVIGVDQDSVINGPQTPILTRNMTRLEFSISEKVDGFTYTLEKMQADQDFRLYTESNIMVVITGKVIAVQMGETDPEAGTYRLVVTWNDKETGVEQAATATFFINYSDV